MSRILYGDHPILNGYWPYGGFADVVPETPVIRQTFMKNIGVRVGRTNRAVQNEGYTYNQAGFAYNQAGVSYGGLYDGDILPLTSISRDNKPHIRMTGDIGFVAGTVSPNSGMLIGMLGMTYP